MTLDSNLRLFFILISLLFFMQFVFGVLPAAKTKFQNVVSGMVLMVYIISISVMIYYYY